MSDAQRWEARRFWKVVEHERRRVSAGGKPRPAASYVIPSGALAAGTTTAAPGSKESGSGAGVSHQPDHTSTSRNCGGAETAGGGLKGGAAGAKTVSEKAGLQHMGVTGLGDEGLDAHKGGSKARPEPDRDSAHQAERSSRHSHSHQLHQLYKHDPRFMSPADPHHDPHAIHHPTKVSSSSADRAFVTQAAKDVNSAKDSHPEAKPKLDSAHGGPTSSRAQSTVHHHHAKESTVHKMKHSLVTKLDLEIHKKQEILLNPFDPARHFALGVFYMDYNKPAEAAAAYRRAVELDPANPLAHYNLGCALQQWGHSHNAHNYASLKAAGLLTAGGSGGSGFKNRRCTTGKIRSLRADHVDSDGDGGGGDSDSDDARERWAQRAERRALRQLEREEHRRHRARRREAGMGGVGSNTSRKSNTSRRASLGQAVGLASTATMDREDRMGGGQGDTDTDDSHVTHSDLHSSSGGSSGSGSSSTSDDGLHDDHAEYREGKKGRGASKTSRDPQGAEHADGGGGPVGSGTNGSGHHPGAQTETKDAHAEYDRFKLRPIDQKPHDLYPAELKSLKRLLKKDEKRLLEAGVCFGTAIYLADAILQEDEVLKQERVLHRVQKLRELEELKQRAEKRRKRAGELRREKRDREKRERREERRGTILPRVSILAADGRVSRSGVRGARKTPLPKTPGRNKLSVGAAARASEVAISKRKSSRTSGVGVDRRHTPQDDEIGSDLEDDRSDLKGDYRSRCCTHHTLGNT